MCRAWKSLPDLVLGWSHAQPGPVWPACLSLPVSIADHHYCYLWRRQSLHRWCYRNTSKDREPGLCWAPAGCLAVGSACRNGTQSCLCLIITVPGVEAVREDLTSCLPLNCWLSVLINKNYYLRISRVVWGSGEWSRCLGFPCLVRSLLLWGGSSRRVSRSGIRQVWGWILALLFPGLVIELLVSPLLG